MGRKKEIYKDITDLATSRSRNKKKRGRFRRRRKRDSLPYEISGRQLYILPTRQGWFFLLVLFVMLLGSVNYNNNPGFIFTFLLGSLALVSMLHTHRNLSGIRLLSLNIRPVFAGESARVKVTLRPSGAEHSAIRVGVAGEESVLIDLNGNRDYTVDVDLKTNVRGLHKLEPLTVSTHYPLGLFVAWSKPLPDTTYIVYPEALPSPYSASIDFSGKENDGNIETAGVDDFKEIKSYEPGDPVKRISWKASSRGRGLFTKEFKSYAGASVVLDWNEIHGKGLETRLSCLCDMVLKAHNMNHSYGLKIPGKYIEPGEPKDLLHKQKCLVLESGLKYLINPDCFRKHCNCSVYFA